MGEEINGRKRKSQRRGGATEKSKIKWKESSWSIRRKKSFSRNGKRWNCTVDMYPTEMKRKKKKKKVKEEWKKKRLTWRASRAVPRVSHVSTKAPVHLCCGCCDLGKQHWPRGCANYVRFANCKQLESVRKEGTLYYIRVFALQCEFLRLLSPPHTHTLPLRV